MSSIITGNNKVCAKVAEALGIKHCKWLQIDMHIDEIVTIKAEFAPEIDGVRQLDTIFKQYKLVEKSKQEITEK